MLGSLVVYLVIPDGNSESGYRGNTFNLRKYDYIFLNNPMKECPVYYDFLSQIFISFKN